MNVEKKNQLIERIKTLEGLTGEERSNLLDLLRTSYGLVWEDRPEEVEEHLREAMPVLIEDKDKALTDGGPDAPNHVLIEGDNLEALTTLAYTHAGKIDVIYIDPPYNTGNKDFIYSDSFVDSEDSYRHSKWLSFMAKRLRIAKKLLSDRGVIFISIDDNEQANLKLLCDQVFSNLDFIGTIPWRKRTAKSDVPHNLSQDYEWVICYCKDFFVAGIQKETRKYYTTPDFPNRPWRVHDMTTQRSSVERPNCYFTIINPKTGDKYPANPNRVWANNEETFIQYYQDNRIVFPGDYDFLKISKPVLRYWKEDDMKKAGEMFGFTAVSSNISDYAGMTQDGTKDITSVFGEKAFGFPKPLSLIRHLLKISNPNDKHLSVLDFFAGSGTTLHAVMQLNAEDGGHRQCILVTNNENGICENVTYERNKRVIQGYTKPNGDRVEGLHANNLRYYRTDFVPRTQSPHDLSRLVELSTDMLCIKENLYRPVEIDCNGKKIAKKYARRFQKDDREMIIIYEPKVIPLIVEHIKARDVKHEIKVYVNAPGRYAFDDDFSEVIDKITLCAIPDAILQAYRDVLPKAKDPELPQVNVDEDEIIKALEADSDYSYTDEKGGDQ